MDLLTLLIVILVILWATGHAVIGGSAIHLLLIVALVLLIVRLLQ